jgi:RNA polymerase sigma-70 factor (ECF subfamily)
VKRYTDTAASEPCEPDFEELMIRYQQADPTATMILIKWLSPRLHCFFATQFGSPTDADDMLQELWLRIHRVRHTYRAGEPFLPWVYAIAHRVRIDGYRRRQRLSREIGVDVLPELASQQQKENSTLPFDELIATLPASQREVVTMLKVDGLSIEEVARATASTIGAVKQKAHRAYQRLRRFLQQTAVTRKPAKELDDDQT